MRWKLRSGALGVAIALMAALGAIDRSSAGNDGPPVEGGVSEASPILEGTKPMLIEVTSSAFSSGQRIPKKYTGEGADVSPPIAWKNLPEGTKELALICDDPNAPTPEPWVHWVLYKIPATVESLAEGLPRDARMKEPAGALQGKNSWPSNNIGYRGPMPPPGHGTHHYRFRLYALKSHLTVEPGLDKKQVLQEIKSRILGEGELVGTYER